MPWFHHVNRLARGPRCCSWPLASRCRPGSSCSPTPWSRLPQRRWSERHRIDRPGRRARRHAAVGQTPGLAAAALSAGSHPAVGPDFWRAGHGPPGVQLSVARPTHRSARAVTGARAAAHHGHGDRRCGSCGDCARRPEPQRFNRETGSRGDGHRAKSTACTRSATCGRRYAAGRKFDDRRHIPSRRSGFSSRPNRCGCAIEGRSTRRRIAGPDLRAGGDRARAIARVQLGSPSRSAETRHRHRVGICGLKPQELAAGAAQRRRGS